MAQAFWIVAPGQGELRPVQLPPIGPDSSTPDNLTADSLTIEMLASGISRGTERLVLAGRVPPSEYERMRCPFQQGHFPFPVKYGYSAVGRIAAGPRTGERVFVLHPHQDRFVVPATWANPIPDGVPDGRATLAANMETALNALWDAELVAGERVAVIGAGVVGLLVACLAQTALGVSPLVVDPEPARLELARALGLQAAPAAAAEYDVIIHASGNPAGLVAALACAAFEARIIELSWYGDQLVSLPLGGAFHARRLRLIASQVGQVAPAKRATTSHAQRLGQALALLLDQRYDLLLGPRIGFSQLPAALPALLQSNAGRPHIVVEY